MLVQVFTMSAGVRRSLNLLWTPECLSKCHRDFENAFEMTEAEKLQICGRFVWYT